MTTEEIVVTLTEHDGQIKRHEGRIKALESDTRALQELAKSVAALSERINSQTEKIDGLSADVKQLQIKPAQRWETVVSAIFKAIAAAAVAYILTKIGLGV